MGRLDLLEKPLSELGRKGYSLCCEHFESDQFDVPFERRHLKWNAVPTLFKVSLPIPPTQKRKSGSSPQKKFAKKLGLEKREDQADNGAHRVIGETMKSSSEEKNRLEGILVSSHDNDFQQSMLPNQHDPVVLLKRIAVPEEVNPTAGKKLVIPLAIKKEEDISCPPEMERETVVTAWRKSVQAQQALPSSSAEADVSVHASQVPAAGVEINVMGNHLLQESPAPQKQDSVAKYVRALEDISSGAEVTQEVAVQTPSGRKFKIYVVAVEEPDSSSPPPPSSSHPPPPPPISHSLVPPPPLPPSSSHSLHPAPSGSREDKLQAALRQKLTNLSHGVRKDVISEGAGSAVTNPQKIPTGGFTVSARPAVTKPGTKAVLSLLTQKLSPLDHANINATNSPQASHKTRGLSHFSNNSPSDNHHNLQDYAEDSSGFLEPTPVSSLSRPEPSRQQLSGQKVKQSRAKVSGKPKNLVKVSSESSPLPKKRIVDILSATTSDKLSNSQEVLNSNSNNSSLIHAESAINFRTRFQNAFFSKRKAGHECQNCGKDPKLCRPPSSITANRSSSDSAGDAQGSIIDVKPFEAELEEEEDGERELYPALLSSGTQTSDATPAWKPDRDRKISKGKYTCYICGLKLQRLVNFSVHLRKAHTYEWPYLCRFCDYGCYGDKDLHKHTKTHSNLVKGTYRCRVCGATFARLLQFKFHGFIHKMAVPTSVKKKRLQRALRVQRQKKTEPEATVKVKTEEDVYLRYIRSMTCPVCGERIEEARMLKSHISTHLYLDIQKNVILVRDQSTRKPLDPLSGAVDLSVGKPNNEGQGEAGQAVLQFQNRMVSPCEFIYWCRMCDVSYMRKKELLRHKDEYHPGTDCLYDHKKSLILKSDRKRNSFVCEVCGASFICRSSMKHHAILHTKQDMYQCDVCSVNFANPFSLKKHKRVHAKDKADQNPPAGPPCICEVCGKLLSSKYQLEKHMQIHTRVTTGVTVHECTVCQLTFPNGNRLLRHKEEQHQTNKLVCEICGRTFGNSSGLKIHHYKVHFQQKKDVKPNRVGSRPARKKIVGEKVKFECDICGKCFSAKQTLTYHQGVHTGKGYECHICLRRFYHPSSLSTHVRIHAGEKPHECDVCHRKFLKLDTLQVHYRIHTGEKPFPCQVCGRRFRQSGDRRAHQRRHDARDSQVSTVATTTVPEVVLQEANMATQIISVVSWQ